MRLRKGYLILPFEKILVEIEKLNIHELVKSIAGLLERDIDLHVLLEPVTTKISIGNEVYIVALSTGSLIISSPESIDLNSIENINDKLWFIAEDTWAKVKSLSKKTNIYVHGFNQTKIVEVFRGIVSRVDLTTVAVPFISLDRNPVQNIEVSDLIHTKLKIKLLRPGHIVVNGLREVLLNNHREIEIYKINIDKLTKKPIDILALINDYPFILESLKTKSIVVLGKNIGKYSKKLEDLLVYNSIIYMLINS